MKKLFLLLLPVLLLSCSSEDKPSNQIVGSWSLYSSISVTTTGEEIETMADECSQQSTITFKESGSFVESDYYYNPNTRECVFNESAFNHQMFWEEVSQGQYRIYSEGSTGTTFEMRFPDKSTLWMIEPGEPFERDGVTIEYSALVYKRG